MLYKLSFLALFTVSSLYAESIRLAHFGKSKFLLYLPLYVAEEEGYFKANNLELEYSFSGNDDQTFATLVSGSADLAVGDPIFSAIAAERGFQAKTVALLVKRLAVFGYTSNKQIQEIKNISELSNLRVGSFPAPSTTFTLLTEMNAKLRPLPPMKIVEGAFGTHLAMLNTGTVDIALDIEPSASIAESQGNKVIFSLAKFTEEQATTGINTRSDFIKSKPELIQAFVSGLNRAFLEIRKDPQVAFRTAEKIYPDLEPQIVKKAVSRMLASDCYPKSTLVSDVTWQKAIKTRLDSKDLSKPQATNVAVDNSFSEKSSTAYDQ